MFFCSMHVTFCNTVDGRKPRNHFIKFPNNVCFSKGTIYKITTLQVTKHGISPTVKFEIAEIAEISLQLPQFRFKMAQERISEF